LQHLALVKPSLLPSAVVFQLLKFLWLDLKNSTYVEILPGYISVILYSVAIYDRGQECFTPPTHVALGKKMQFSEEEKFSTMSNNKKSRNAKIFF
jgi:hypothetical protein